VTVHSHSLSQRYGAPPRWRRYVLLGFVVLVVGALAGWLAWVTVVQSDPPVSSELISSEIVDDHTATAVIRVQWGDDPVDAQCTVRALAHDKAVVGQATFAPDADGGPDHEVEIATERRATAVENIGCTAEDQPRPR
jgi:4-amino-4-deoxy-L-arabinose transferase-like glycosyltransferase